MEKRYRQLVKSGELPKTDFTFRQLDDSSWQCVFTSDDVPFSTCGYGFPTKEKAKAVSIRAVCEWHDGVESKETARHCFIAEPFDTSSDEEAPEHTLYDFFTNPTE